MKRLGIVLAVLVGLYCLYKLQHPSYVYRFRIALNVDTPSGPKSGSGVLEVRARRYPAWTTLGNNSGETRLRGEAVFVDLGAGSEGKPQHVIALLVSGPRGENVDFHSLPNRVFEALWSQKPVSPNYHGSAAEMVKLPLGTKAELYGGNMPTLVAFRDLSDPKTASVVDPTNFEATFGRGFRLKSATMEIVYTARWPLTLFAFLGKPVTREIEVRNSEIIRKLYEQSQAMQVVRPDDPFRARYGQFIRN